MAEQASKKEWPPSQSASETRARHDAVTATGRAHSASLSFPNYFFYLLQLNIEVWLSLVERYVRDVEVASSNLVTSTKIGFESNLKAFSFVYRTVDLARLR